MNITFRPHRTRTIACGCGWPDRTQPHDFVVTAPPGFGAVHHPCIGAPVAGVPAGFGDGVNVAQQFRAQRSGVAA